MIRLHIMLNNRRRFVISAAMGALLVLLAGGSNALAAVTVRCVPNLSVNPSCAVAYGHIQDAVANASFGDPIFVGPGTYHESVTITTNGIFLFGAQAGNDARVDRHDPTKESIVDATGTGHSAIIVAAHGAVIDGFTVTGGTAGTSPAGISLGNYYSPQVVNNILKNNSTGVFVYKGYLAVIEHNLFRNNTAGTGTNVGFGVNSNGGMYPVITENEFTGNRTTAIGVYEGGNAIITNNTSENDGSFVICVSLNQGLFSHNQGKNFGHKGVLPVVVDSSSIYADAAVDIGPGNSGLVIGENDLEKGEAPISNGIAFTTVFATTALGTSPNLLVNVKNNKIKGFPGNGIVVEELSGVGTLNNCSIAGNEVQDNGLDGILIEGPASTDNYGIFLFENEAEGNHVFDCADDMTKGFGTLGTGNNWSNNTGNLSYPTGLCTPGRRHDHDDWRR